jgi:hypothetical protein
LPTVASAIGDVNRMPMPSRLMLSVVEASHRLAYVSRRIHTAQAVTIRAMEATVAASFMGLLSKGSADRGRPTRRMWDWIVTRRTPVVA